MVDSMGAKTLKHLAEKLALTGTLIFITDASLKVRRSLLLAGLSKPMIRYAKTADQAVRFFHGRLGQAATA
jgi:SulP family sulfate permease